jgi:hypothetical protein
LGFGRKPWEWPGLLCAASEGCSKDYYLVRNFEQVDFGRKLRKLRKFFKSRKYNYYGRITCWNAVQNPVTESYPELYLLLRTSAGSNMNRS